MMMYFATDMPLASFLDGYFPADPWVAGLVIVAIVIAAIAYVISRRLGGRRIADDTPTGRRARPRRGGRA